MSTDREPSRAGMDIEDRDDCILWLLKVAGLGAILPRAELVAGVWVFHGISTFTNQDIGI